MQSFIYKTGEALKTFIHYTENEEVAKFILNDGFKYHNNFHKTAELLDEEWSLSAYNHYRQKCYGDNIIVIKIPQIIYDNIRAIYNELELGRIPPVENLLSKKISEKFDEDYDLTHKLKPRFIKGYVNYVKGLVVENPLYNPQMNKEDILSIIKSSNYLP